MPVKEKKHEEYKAEYLKEYEEPVFNPEKIAWINDITINSDLSIE